MMELTPLDVRKKKGDFRRGLRGYEPGSVDDFLDLVADRLETLVRDAVAQKEKVARLEQQVADYRDREKALTEALVTAQEMREEIRAQSAREVDLLRRQAEQDAEAIRGGAERAREREEESLNALRAKQLQFLASYRSYLEQELSDLAAHARGIEMQGGRAASGGKAGGPRRRSEPAPAPHGATGPAAAAAPAGAEPAARPPAPGDKARPAAGASRGGAAVAAAAAGPAPATPAYTRAQPPASASGAVREPGDAEIDAHVGAALAEWTTEFDDVAGSTEEPDLILSDADVVVETPDPAGAGVEGPGTGSPEPPAGPGWDESTFREEVSAAFGGETGAQEDLLDLDSFDSLKGRVDPALGEAIVGPPPVIPPDQLTISPVFLERTDPGGESGGAEPEGDGQDPPKRDRFTPMFEDDG